MESSNECMLQEVFRVNEQRLCFFFSSRRRHTRWPRDWSSDVCSSDLLVEVRKKADAIRSQLACPWMRIQPAGDGQVTLFIGDRSEERRVGKECRCRRGP